MTDLAKLPEPIRHFVEKMLDGDDGDAEAAALVKVKPVPGTALGYTRQVLLYAANGKRSVDEAERLARFYDPEGYDAWLVEYGDADEADEDDDAGDEDDDEDQGDEEPAEPGIFKVDEERRRIYGIALVADVEDAQGDIIGDLDLEDAACRAIEKGCIVKIDHAGGAVGRLVASWPMTQEIAKAMGFDLPAGRGMWLVGLQIEDDRTWAKVKSGELGHAMSIGGRAAKQEE